MSVIRRIYFEFNNSIKSRDTEEKLDLFFYRPLGFILAKIAHLLKMNPSQLSLLGLVCAVIAGILYATHSESFGLLIWASILFLLSGIFDSSDGQLARMAGSGSKIGLVIDGLCDAGATVSIYLGVFWPLFQDNALWGIVVFLAALSHSYQCAILDFYHREYLFFGYGITNKDYWNPTVGEMSEEINRSYGLERLTYILRRNWVKQQTRLSVRSDQLRLKMKSIVTGENAQAKIQLQDAYREVNLPMLTFWRLIGTNAHTIVIITCVLTANRSVILWFDLLIFNLIIFLGRTIQRNRDNHFLNKIQLSWS